MGASRRQFLKDLGTLVTLPSVAGTFRNSSFDAELASIGRPTTDKIKKIPLIHCTDLFHPPDDPDDHVDLATVFALPQLDVRAIILDQGIRQAACPGKIPIEQMAALTGRTIPYATGLGTPLRYPEDDGRNQFSFYQAGVELILRVLRESEEKVVFTIVGSARDVAAAYNRDPGLFHQKVVRLYFADGNSAGRDFQWGPLLDPQAYVRLMALELPVYWCPAFGGQDTLEGMAAGKFKPDKYRVYWRFRQSEIFSALPAPLQNYFLYALSRKDASVVEPIAYLSKPVEEALRDQQWKEIRHMWSTAAIYDAAGCDLYRKKDSWVASPDSVPGFEKVRVYEFVPARVSLDRNLRATLDFAKPAQDFKIFHLPETTIYEPAMESSLRRLLSQLTLRGQFAGVR
jgi:hypothetical protein